MISLFEGYTFVMSSSRWMKKNNYRIFIECGTENSLFVCKVIFYVYVSLLSYKSISAGNLYLHDTTSYLYMCLFLLYFCIHQNSE